MKKRLNIFDFATSELSQDAFISWLISWGDNRFETVDKYLNAFAKDFVQELLGEPFEVKTVNVAQQRHKIDILVLLNEEEANRTVICIESKAFTDEHSEQLNRYYQTVEKEYENWDFRKYIFFKTGHVYKVPRFKHFVFYGRQQFLNVLKKGIIEYSINNQIFIDYFDYLKSIESAIRQFREKPFTEWTDADYTGFYSELTDPYHRLSLGEYFNGNYVPKGGFIGFWWNFKPLSNFGNIDLYLQFEWDKLCIKIEWNETQSYSREICESVYGVILEAHNLHGIWKISLKKSSFKAGKTNTIASFSNVISIRKNNLIDWYETMENIRQTERVLTTASLRFN